MDWYQNVYKNALLDVKSYWLVLLSWHEVNICRFRIIYFTVRWIAMKDCKNMNVPLQMICNYFGGCVT